MKHFIANPFAGLIVIGIFALWVLISELATIYIGGEIAGIFWLTFRFMINPIAGLIVVVFVLLILAFSLNDNLPFLEI